MVKIKSVDFDSELLERIRKIENSLTRGLDKVEEKLSKGIFEIFNDGLKTYKEGLLKESNASKRILWLERIRADKDLRFPHRKILDFLLDQYDFTRNEFKEVQFSVLVNGSRIGKNMANEYLSLLEQKKYIQKRSDGYRKFFKIPE